MSQSDVLRALEQLDGYGTTREIVATLAALSPSLSRHTIGHSAARLCRAGDVVAAGTVNQHGGKGGAATVWALSDYPDLEGLRAFLASYDRPGERRTPPRPRRSASGPQAGEFLRPRGSLAAPARAQALSAEPLGAGVAP